ncbi:CvpA family protein [Commensalibacter oyaizuii]|uniref:CvpA family protein n=1 Tax=Commensalibacter oyaizuii TaxID=3043873 RepID=A0ABT6Q414_9PROT|nr:CvpA family protein [Commensalibacter sp. TBRC 16381]MDI2091765.1 CvpA family protein [Commensalibacter sp. TBRC 16381]
MLDTMNWIDLVCLGVVILGALSGLTRGFTREFIGLFGWIIAASLANRWYPDLTPKITPYISSESVANIIAFIAIFLLASIVINTLANVIVGQNSTRFSILGRLDRILGAVCGGVKGYAGLAIIYLVGSILVPGYQWPETLQESQVVPYIYKGAVYINDLLPTSMQREVVVPQLKTPRMTIPQAPSSTKDTFSYPDNNDPNTSAQP